jgi:hypothetical protein
MPVRYILYLHGPVSVWEEFRMPFSADDLRYRVEQTYPALCAYLSRQARSHLGILKHDTYEIDVVVGDVVEKLTRLGVLGGQDAQPLTALDRMSNAQFYTFLGHMVRNKAIDRLRKYHMRVSSFSELESPDGSDVDDNPLNETVDSLWGDPPFATPETATLALVAQQELRAVLIHCIKRLESAPHQLEAVLEEIKEVGGDEALHVLFEEFHPVSDQTSLAHISQHKDHAHRKLRLCLQEGSSNLIVHVALRLIQYGKRNPHTGDFLVDIRILAGGRLTEDDVQTGLHLLTVENLLNWHGEEHLSITASQMKQLQRYYRED